MRIPMSMFLSSTFMGPDIGYVCDSFPALALPQPHSLNPILRTPYLWLVTPPGFKTAPVFKVAVAYAWMPRLRLGHR